jgi:hypothetical protein
MRTFVCAVAAMLCLALPARAQDNALARTAASELRAMCQADRGQLWRADLCGPLLVVDPTTRAVWASQADFGGVLTRAGDGWVGVLPAGAPIANSSATWSGVRWIMVMGPLPQDETQRRVLLAHEAWHWVQEQIGLSAQPSTCAHLESERGRYLMRLELRALASAMRSRSSARRHAAEEALQFRAARLAEFQGAAGQEAALDRNEGLAAYTGVKLGAAEADFYAARTLDQYDTHDAFARAYAYASGPAYGLLLDDYAEGWRTTIGPYSPADLLAGVLRVQQAPPPRDLRRLAERYGGPTIASEERGRAEARQLQVAALRQQFGSGPRLELALAPQAQYEFDPNQVTPLDGLGSVYARLRLRDVWGELVATQGALIDPGFTRLTTAAPGPDGRTGPGWSLRLNPGYTVSPPNLDGVYRVIPRTE